MLPQRIAILSLLTLTAVNCARIDELGSKFFKKEGAASVKGQIIGLTGQNLTLSVNGESYVVAGSPVEFTSQLKNGDTYTLAIAAQPQGPQQLCTFTSATTGVASGGVIPFELTCSTGTYTVAGNVTGLTGSGLQIQLNGGEIVPVSAASFSFTTRITDRQGFNVQVKQQPSSPVQICTPEFNVGIIAGANVTDVSILCSTVPYSVGGYVNALANGASVTLQINGGQNTVRTSDGFFLFPTPLADQTDFDVTVLTQPTGQTCSVQNGSGVIDGRGSYATYIQCSSTSYSVSGTVNGLSGGYVTLVTSAGEYAPVVANGAFMLSRKFAAGSAYAVEVFRNPALPAQTCTVTNGTGTNISGDVGSVNVICSTTGYTVGGPVTGLTGSGLVLRLNGTSDVVVPVGSTAYTFATSVASGGSYSVAVLSQPAALKCSVTPLTATGSVSTANITNVAVTCQNGYTVGGTVTGLAGTNLVLRNTVNGATSDFVISGNSFTFPELLVTGDTYSTQVLNHPESPYQSCGMSNSGGTIASANITNISVSCSTITVQFAAATSNANEASGTIDIPINISPASARPLNLTLALAAGSAAAGVDFSFLTPTITVPVGATSVNAQIQVFGDTDFEPSETVIINLAGVDKAALGTTLNHTHTITNDDGVTSTKLVVTNSGSNFTAGGSTTITVQVQDALNNVATTDSSTQITLTPTGSTAMLTYGGTCSGCGVAGGAATVTVVNGSATVTVANTKAETFQISVSDSGPLTDPSPISLTTSPGPATQLVISQAPGNTTAGGSTSMTIEVRDANNNVVTNATTAITFDPTLAGTITGVTTGSGDGSYGVAGGAETITVVGGVATITLGNTTAQTYSIAITNNGGFANPGAPSVTVSAAAANQLVLSSPAPDFLASASTSLTVQVRDTYGNVVVTDSTTEVTFTPSGSGRITNQSPGAFVSGDGSAGTARVVRVASGVATVTIENSVSETFTVSFAAGGLSVPSPDSITASAGATKIAITQAGGSFFAGGTTTLTVQVQTTSNTLVNTDGSTVVTFDPTNSGTVSGITTGTLSTGSTGTPGAPVGVMVNGGVATITLTNSVVETFEVAITNGAGLTNPPNDSITVTGATGAVITNAEYFDINHNGKIDRVKITFDKNVDEATISGDITTQFLIAGYSGVALVSGACIDESYPTNGNCTDPGEVNDTATNEIFWLSFTEGALYDTGATPDLTGVNVSLRTTAAGGSCFIHTSAGDCNTQSAADFGTAAVAEADKAPPVFVAAWSDPIIDAWQLKLQFSEAVDLSAGVAACAGTVTNAAFTYNNISSSNTSALRTDFADNNGCDSASGHYYIIPRVNARFAHGDLKTDTIALAATFYDSLGQSTIATTKTIGYDPNLELYYPVDAAAPVSDTDNNTLHDVTANNRHGAITGAVRVRDMGENNYSALKFDGDDYVTVTGYKGVTGTADRTVSAWVWSDHGFDGGGDHNRCNIMQWGGGNAFGMALNHQGSNRGGLVLLAGSNLQNKTNLPAATGGWMHVAITWANDGTPDGADAILYINGVAQAVANAGGSMNTTSSSDVILGKGFTATDSLFRGKMDEMRIYSRALSAIEIKKLAVKVPSGLVAHYPLDNDGAADFTGNGLNGSANNAATVTNDRYGSSNAAYTFNGASQRYPVVDNALLRPAVLTVSAWIWHSSWSTCISEDRTAISKPWTDAGYLIECDNTSGKISWDVYRNGTFARVGILPALVTNGTWVHVTGTYDGRYAKFYANGTLIETNDAGGTFPITHTTQPFTIGGGPVSSYYNGRIDDVRVYNRVLSDGEVKALATEPDRGLVAYYPLDDAAATARDYSGSGNDLTAVNGPTQATGYNGTPSGAYNFVAASSQYLTHPSGSNLPLGAATRTLCAWSRPVSLGSVQVIARHGDSITNQGSALFINSTGVPGLSAFNNFATSPLAAGSTWQHLCATYDGARASVIINGNIELSNQTFTMNTTGLAMYVGSADGNNYFNGPIDDVRIYNRALSLAEIRELSGFYPAHVANMSIWFDASRIGDTGNLSPIDGSIFDNWKDLSLNGFDATRGNPSGNKPTFYNSVINGLPAIRYAGGQWLENSSFARNLNTTAHTQLSVFRASGGGAITAQKSGGGSHYRYNTGPVLQSEIGGVATNSNTAYVNNTPVIGGLTYSNPNGVFYRNGALDGSFSQTAASKTSTWTFGGSDNGTTPFLTGDIAEIVIYDRVLMASELEKVNCYYNKKYAIAVTGLVCE